MRTQNKPTQLFYANTVSFQIIEFSYIYSPIWIILRCTVAADFPSARGLYKSILMNTQSV